MRDVLSRLELLAAWLKPGGAYPDEPIPDKYSTLVEAIAEIKRLRVIHQLKAGGTMTNGKDYANDPTDDPRWNDGCNFAMTQLCQFLGVDPDSVRWDAATETVEGDVQAVIGNIMRAKFGEDFAP